MLMKGDLSTAFKIYWDNAERCIQAKAYWFLLHVTVCLPDICAALQSRDGVARPEKYKKWSDKYFRQDALTGLERYEIRCKVLHQGRVRSKRGRYSGFAFGQPDASAKVDHLRVDGRTLHIDVAMLYDETRRAIRAWIIELESNPTSDKASYAAKNLPLLAHVSNQSVPLATSGPLQSFIVMSKTN